MQDNATLTSPAPLAPLPARERIEALDVVRGFALIGICLMNLDFFNRSVLAVGTGLPPGLTGIDYWAAFFTGYFVTGKFWTMFSLLFGMGFAVMLTRAEEAGRSFIAPYLRRIFALAVFGAAHHIFLWGGDILFSYAIAAVFLVIALYGGWKIMLGGLLLFGGLAAIPGMDNYGAAIPTFIVTGLTALYLRADSRRFSLPPLSLLAFAVAALVVVGGVLMLVLGFGPKGVAIPMLVGGSILALIGWLAKRFQEPASRRAVRAAAFLWVLLFGMMSIGSGLQLLAPKPSATPAVTAPAPAPQTAAAKEAADAAAKQKEARAKAEKERAENIARDTRVVSTGTYAEGVAERASQFLKRPPKEFGFAVILVPVFLLGTWFIRSGIMANTAAHLPLFRKLALFGIPVGVGLGLLGSLVATSHVPGAQDGFQFAFSLLMLGSLPASLGYVGLVILALHSRALSKIRVLAPFGRMALTNYLMQSLVCAVFFYGWGFGNWGMGRAAQLGFALALCAVQIVISHLWLQHFRYGPLEWLWRAVTYMKVPAMRIERAPAGAVPQPN